MDIRAMLEKVGTKAPWRSGWSSGLKDESNEATPPFPQPILC